MTRNDTPLKPGEWSVGCCEGRYTGLKTAHCTVCHETFTTPAGFDRHRSRGTCLDPATMVNSKSEPVFKNAGRAYKCWAFSGEYDHAE